MNLRTCLMDSFHAAVETANPAHTVPRHLPNPAHVPGRMFVIGAGKASAAMALAVERSWPENKVLEGMVVTRYGYNQPTRRIEVVEAGHPVPDYNGMQAAQIILKQVKRLTKHDFLLCLFSGGGSSLLPLPPEDVTLADLQELTEQLLRCGASIQEINTIRKHLSCIQGGRLAAVCRAPVRALMISDVTGDDPAHIASGPCAPDPTRFSDALAILSRYQLNVPSSIRNRLIAGDRQQLNETPKPGASIFKHVENIVIASAHQSLAAARNYFQKQHFNTLILGDTVTGEAREVAKVFAAFIKEIRRYPDILKPPAALLSGGETTVTVKGNGSGGRNTEFLLSLLIELDGLDGVYALACDTDGIDGSEDNAGALITPDTLARAHKKEIQAGELLANNDAYRFFEQLGDLVITGPTYTNVNDYRAMLIV